MNLPPLRDIQLPPPPSLWPPAPGWWLLAAALLLLMIGLALLLRRWWRQRRWRRSLKMALDDALTAQAPGPLAAALSELLRRVARKRDPAAAALEGEAWLAWLDSTGGAGGFSSGPGRILLDAPFQRQPRVDREPLVQLVRRWLAQQPC